MPTPPTETSIIDTPNSQPVVEIAEALVDIIVREEELDNEDLGIVSANIDLESDDLCQFDVTWVQFEDDLSDDEEESEEVEEEIEE